MPDIHTLTGDVESARKEFLAQARLCVRWLEDVDVSCVPVIRFVREFLEKHPRLLEDVIDVVGRRVLVEVWEERFFYFVAKLEFNFVDRQRKAACLGTVQLDVENAERFGITYVDEAGGRRHPFVLHSSIPGAIDRNVYAILETQALCMDRGLKARWPMWLAPSQARLLPVSEGHVGGARELAQRIPFRIDVDDRNLAVGRKVRDAEREWVPYVVVLGDRERASGRLRVRARDGAVLDATAEELEGLLGAETAGYPTLPVNLPIPLSTRASFGG